MPFVEAQRTATRSVAAPAEDQRRVLIEAMGRQLHPRLLRFGDRLFVGINPGPHHGRCRWRHGPDSWRARQTQRRPVTARILRLILRYRTYALAATHNRTRANAPRTEATRTALSATGHTVLVPCGFATEVEALYPVRAATKARYRVLAVQRTALGSS